MKTLAIASLLVAPACLSGDFDVPANAYIVCASDADCPDGYVCSQSLGLCLEPTGDHVAPGFVPGTFTVTPLAASVGTDIQVEFTVTEALAYEPEVTLGSPALTFERTDGDAPEYQFTYTVIGDEAEDDIPVIVELIDLAGNVATLGGLNVTLDFTPPAVVSPSISATTVTVGDIVTVTFTASETLDRTPDVVWMTTLPEAFDHVDATNYTFTLDTTGLDTTTANVRITLTDEAGNVSQTVLDSPLTVDPI